MTAGTARGRGAMRPELTGRTRPLTLCPGAEVMGHGLSVLAIAATVALPSGCSDSSTPPGADGEGGVVLGDGGAPDGPFSDRDGDGLCDGTERSRGTDVEEPDTDGDGFTDYYELLFQYDPLRPADPNRDRIFSLHETAGSMTEATITETVRGSGEDYVGAFEARAVRGSEGMTAADFYESSVASHASPSGNAAAVERDAQTFRGVVGETKLFYEVRFAFDEQTPQRCLHGYPFVYTVKRGDGRIVSRQRFLLLVLPSGQSLDSAGWCAPAEPCL